MFILISYASVNKNDSKFCGYLNIKLMKSLPKILPVFAICLLTISCNDEINDENTISNLSYTYSYNLSSPAGETINADVGIWLFNEQTLEVTLAKSVIAFKIKACELS